MNKELRCVFFGSSRFSELVLAELEKAGLTPVLNITSTKAPLPPLEELRALEPDVFIVASFGKILPKELLAIPQHGSLNVHPSLLPELRGPAPIQGTILGLSGVGGGAPTPAVTIIKMDEQMDHGPILAQEKVAIEPWPDHYAIVEKKLGSAGGALLAKILPSWVNGELKETEQDHSQATYIKLVKKEDGLLDLAADPQDNYRKVLAYSTWPGAYFFFKTKMGKELRIVVKDAQIIDGKFVPTRIIPEGKREMIWEDFLRGNA